MKINDYPLIEPDETSIVFSETETGSGKIKLLNFIKTELKWKPLHDAIDISAGNRESIPIPDPDTFSEIYIRYGRKNGGQIYGGGSITIPSSLHSSPFILPVFCSGGNEGLIYFAILPDNTLNYELLSSTNGYDFRFMVYYR